MLWVFTRAFIFFIQPDFAFIYEKVFIDFLNFYK